MISQRTIAEINAVLRRDLGPQFMGSITFNLGQSVAKCSVDVRHCMHLDPANASLTLIDRNRNTAVK